MYLFLFFPREHTTTSCIKSDHGTRACPRKPPGDHSWRVLPSQGCWGITFSYSFIYYALLLVLDEFKFIAIYFYDRESGHWEIVHQLKFLLPLKWPHKRYFWSFRLLIPSFLSPPQLYSLFFFSNFNYREGILADCSMQYRKSCMLTNCGEREILQFSLLPWIACWPLKRSSSILSTTPLFPFFSYFLRLSFYEDHKISPLWQLCICGRTHSSSRV